MKKNFQNTLCSAAHYSYRFVLPLLQKDVDGGIDYAKRKVNLVRDKVEQLAQIIQTRQAALAQIQAFAAEKQQTTEEIAS